MNYDLNKKLGNVTPVSAGDIFCNHNLLYVITFLVKQDKEYYTNWKSKLLSSRNNSIIIKICIKKKYIITLQEIPGYWMHDGSVPEWPIQNARALPT